jgi:hypothetical protein
MRAHAAAQGGMARAEGAWGRLPGHPLSPATGLYSGHVAAYTHTYCRLWPGRVSCLGPIWNKSRCILAKILVDTISLPCARIAPDSSVESREGYAEKFLYNQEFDGVVKYAPTQRVCVFSIP